MNVVNCDRVVNKFSSTLDGHWKSIKPRWGAWLGTVIDRCCRRFHRRRSIFLEKVSAHESHMVREKTVMARLDGNKNANESGKEKRRKIECFLFVKIFTHLFDYTYDYIFYFDNTFTFLIFLVVSPSSPPLSSFSSIILDRQVIEGSTVPLCKRVMFWQS